jgi:hypothetical protein
MPTAGHFTKPPTIGEYNALKNTPEQKIVFGSAENKSSSSDVTDLPAIFGMPPDNLLPETRRKQLDSMPTCHFYPSQPVFKFGLDLFFLKSCWKESNNSDPSYIDLLNSHGLSTPNSAGKGIQVAYLADNFPTDTFTNEYGENFLQGVGDVASSTAAQINQIFGIKDAREGIKKLAYAAASALPTGFNLPLIGNIPVRGAAESFVTGAGKLISNLVNAAGLNTGVGYLGRLAAGARLDFPMVWKSAGFQPSYSLTIRLYNPNPRSIESTKKYIVGPIVALMLLGVPITQDGATYSWPYLHKIVSPGIFELNPGFISNITVIKGGDQQQISQQQHLAMADVRIDIGSLYSTMVAGKNTDARTRPTVRKYMDTMLQAGSTSPRRHAIYDRQAIRLESEARANQTRIDTATKVSKNQNVWSPNRVKYPSPSQGKPPTVTDTTETPNTRVSTTHQNQSSFLAAATPPGYGERATEEEQ